MTETEKIAQLEPDPTSVDGQRDPRTELLPEREWCRREVMFLARQVVAHRHSALGQSKLDQLGDAIEHLDETPRGPDPSLVVRHLRQITDTHPEAPVGELVSEVRRLVDNDDYCTSEHYSPERDQKRAELHLGHPPADLPVAIESGGDVRRVCVRYGMTEAGGDYGPGWEDEAAGLSLAMSAHGWSLEGPGYLFETSWGLPTAALTGAIQAARSAS